MKKQELRVGDVVQTWQGGFGRVVGITPDGWFQIKDAVTDTVDEWQGFQLRLRARLGTRKNRPEFYE